MFQVIQKTVVRIFLTCILVGYASMNQTYAQYPQLYVKNRMQIDDRTGAATAVYNVDSREYNGTPDQIARQYLLENKAILGMKENLSDLEFIEVGKSPAAYHVLFTQHYQHVPVMRAEVLVSINHQNRVTMIMNDHKPNISINLVPIVTKNGALEAAKQAIDIGETSDILIRTSDLVVYEDSAKIFHLAWKVSLVHRFHHIDHRDWLVIQDAHTGKILEIIDTVYDYVDGDGSVFNPDPVTALMNPNLSNHGDEDHSDYDDAYKPVDLYDLNDAIEGVYRIQGKYACSLNIVAGGPPSLPDPVTRTDTDFYEYDRSQHGFEEESIYYFIGNGVTS